LAAGCAGFVYALDVANRLVGSGAYEHVLIIGADLLSRYVDFSDRSTCVLFGDGAGAAIVAPVAAERGVVATQLGADGRGVDKLYVPAGGTRRPLTAEGLAQRDNTIKMVGNEVFKFAVRILADATLDVLAQVDLEPADIDLFVPHQANVRIMDAAAKRLGLPPEKVFANVARYGNTSAASIPIALDEAVATGRLAEGDLVALVGFGTGLAWAAALMYWGGAETAQ
ncbi:MAG TPA: beta-ketoacyl-ACP synthase 3, partial [Limnochordia bacterium]|nr:beta-ketoacyl-ACP synthase 3 [Limnochordia bacterium]